MSEILVNLKDVLKDIRFDERFYSEEEHEWTYYFIAPAKVILEAFPEKYKPEEVVSSEIRISFSRKKKYIPDMGALLYSRVSISPTSEGEDGFTDYDWSDIIIPDEQELRLLDMGMRDSMSFDEYCETRYIMNDLCSLGTCDFCDKIRACVLEAPMGNLKNFMLSYSNKDELIQHAMQIYNKKCKGKHEEEKLFKVHISEVLEKTVTVYANSEDEAYEKAEEMCNRGSIDLNGTDFTSRTVEVVGKSSTRINNEELNSDIKIVLFIPEEELKNMELYRSEDSMLSVDELQAICDSVESTQNDVVFAAATCGSTKFEICTTSNRHNLYLIESKLLPDFNYETVEVTNISSEIERLRNHWSLIDRLLVLNYWD